MRNPWLGLPRSAPLVLPADRPHVEAFNEAEDQQPGRGYTTRRLRLDMVPEPWVGNPRRARALVLQLNPGFHPRDLYWHRQPSFRRAARENLEHRRAEFPFYLLDPAFAASPGGTWWRRRIGKLLGALEHAGRGDAALRRLANRLAAVELHGYHSNEYRPIPATLPSQRYSFHLVEKAIERGCVIVIARGARDWSIAVPALRRHDRVYRLSNAQSTYISPANLGGKRLGAQRFDKIVEALA